MPCFPPRLAPKSRTAISNTWSCNTDPDLIVARRGTRDQVKPHTAVCNMSAIADVVFRKYGGKSRDSKPRKAATPGNAAGSQGQARSGGVSGRRRIHRVDATETVCEESRELDLFLFDESRLRQMAGAEHVEHGADAAGRRNLDGTAHAAAQRRRVDLVGVGFLDELTSTHAADGDEHDNDVLQRDGHGVFKDIFQ